MKIAICVPYYRDTCAEFARSYGDMIIHALTVGLTYRGETVRPIFGSSWATSSSIAENRERIASEALKGNPDFLLWLDTDHKFPPNTLARLFAHMARAKVVGCNYSRRGRPTGPTAVNIRGGDPEPVYTTKDKARHRIVEQVDSMGLGLCLMSVDVLRAVERPWFAPSPGGEDGYFFSKIGVAGFKPFVDHQLSWEVGHIGDTIYTAADAEADRAIWKGPLL